MFRSGEIYTFYTNVTVDMDLEIECTRLIVWEKEIVTEKMLLLNPRMSSQVLHKWPIILALIFFRKAVSNYFQYHSKAGSLYFDALNFKLSLPFPPPLQQLTLCFNEVVNVPPWARHEGQREQVQMPQPRISEKSFVFFIQYPPDEGLFLLDWRQFLATQKRVAAL